MFFFLLPVVCCLFVQRATVTRWVQSMVVSVRAGLTWYMIWWLADASVSDLWWVADVTPAWTATGT